MQANESCSGSLTELRNGQNLEDLKELKDFSCDTFDSNGIYVNEYLSYNMSVK